MKSLLSCAAWIGLAVYAGGNPLLAQLRDNSEKQMTCDNGGNDGDRVRHCEIREQTMPAAGRLSVDASPNGGVSVKGWLRGEVLVRSRIDTSADTAATATALARQVSIDGSAGQVQARGPESTNDASWNVSYEIFVPQATDLVLKTHNGGITISDVRGQIQFNAQNGGVHLRRVAGDVSGATVNGGIQVELTGAIWDGRQLEVSTTNGGVTLKTPAAYSAHIQAETHNGRIQSDFPMDVQGNLKPRQLDFNLGTGGALIHVHTENGSVRLERAESQ